MPGNPPATLKIQNRILAAFSGAAFLSTGCISHDETIVKDVEQLPVSFENDTAGRLFYETLSRTNVRRGRQEDSTQVQIPIVFEHKVRTVTGEGAAFNEAVGRCDTNRDGKITGIEAKIFADQDDEVAGLRPFSRNGAPGWDRGGMLSPRE